MTFPVLVVLGVGALVLPTLAVPCSWMEEIRPWTIGFKAVLKIKMEETLDQWMVGIGFTQPVVDLEAWKGTVTEISNINYTIANKCYNNMVYSCQCLELPFIVRHDRYWEGTQDVTFNGQHSPSCSTDPCAISASTTTTTSTTTLTTPDPDAVPACIPEDEKDDTWWIKVDKNCTCAGAYGVVPCIAGNTCVISQGAGYCVPDCAFDGYVNVTGNGCMCGATGGQCWEGSYCEDSASNGTCTSTCRNNGIVGEAPLHSECMCGFDGGKKCVINSYCSDYQGTGTCTPPRSP